MPLKEVKIDALEFALKDVETTLFCLSHACQLSKPLCQNGRPMQVRERCVAVTLSQNKAFGNLVQPATWVCPCWVCKHAVRNHSEPLAHTFLILTGQQGDAVVKSEVGELRKHSWVLPEMEQKTFDRVLPLLG